MTRFYCIKKMSSVTVVAMGFEYTLFLMSHNLLGLYWNIGCLVIISHVLFNVDFGVFMGNTWDSLILSPTPESVKIIFFYVGHL